MRMEGGARVYVDFEDDLPRGDPVVTIRGDHGMIVLEEHHQRWSLRARSTRTWTFPLAEDFRPIPMTARMLHGLLSEEEVACTGADGLAALDVILAAHRSSADGGRPVTLPLDRASREVEVHFP
jgi:predicted dehydrogenase